MNAEALHDAISLLPEDMLTPVDKLRQQKRIPWKSIAAAAACLCLVVGLWLIDPSNMVAMDSANGGAAPEVGDPAAEGFHSTSSAGLVVQVVGIETDCIKIMNQPAGELADENICIQLSAVTLTFENLEQLPQVQVGQNIRIYYEPDQFDEKNLVVKPYKIEIAEE